jgi:uncharacterized protein (TIRG00374 family)
MIREAGIPGASRRPIVRIVQQGALAFRKYHAAGRKLVCSSPWVLLAALIVTILYYFNRFILAYCLVHALGGKAEMSRIIMTQSRILFLPYFAPTPGASGFAEFSINGLMSGMLAGSQLFSFTYLYRFLLYYVSVAIGGLVLAKEMRAQIAESSRNSQ